MGKIVIVGTTHSGKSCYFYGMMKKMMRGIGGFSIGADGKDFGEIRQNIKKLSDINLPLAQRFPPPSDKMRTYPLSLMYDFSELEKFDWVDYPGEHVSNSEADFVALLEDADCLLVCVDGEGIQGDPEELDDLADELVVTWDCLSLNNALNLASQKNENFPPVCIMVTKYDKLEPEFRNQDILLELLKKVFPVLFHSGMGSGKDRMVLICPVTLGKDLDLGARMSPKNMEIPICFATYLLQARKVKLIEQKNIEIVNANRSAVNEYNKKNPLLKLISSRPEPLTQEQLKVMQAIVDLGSANVDALRDVIKDTPLYLNGEEVDWD